MIEILEIQLVKEAFDLDIFSVYGNDPYTIELILLTQAWMSAVSPDERKNTHLWGFIKKLKSEIPIPPDAVYRNRMQKLWKTDVVEGIRIGRGWIGKFDYVLTEYGQAVYTMHVNSLRKQIRLKKEKWLRRALRENR